MPAQPESMPRNEEHPVNPYVFVVGCPRSGTTLLQRMLDNHPQLTVANDTHFITRAVKTTLRRDPNPQMKPDFLEAVLNYRRTYRMGLEDVDIQHAATDSDTYAEFVSKLYNLRGARQNKPFSGEKTPDYCRQIPELHTLFPGSRFIHIVRDGRDTTLSTLGWATETKGPGKWGLWKGDPVGTCALWWRWQVGTGDRDGRTLPAGQYRSLRYEDLVSNPQAELREITGLLTLPYSEDMVNYHTGKMQKKSGLSAKSAWLPPVQGLRDWREDMSPEDISVFENIAGDLLSHFGYECLGHRTMPSVTRRVRRCLEWWNREGKERR
jgi:hypothetical protein